jgi:hypothetical protein
MASSTPLVGMRPWTLLWLICTFLLTPTPLDPIISGGFFEDRQRGNCQLRSCKTCCYGRSSTWTILTGNTQAGTYLAAAKIGRAPGYHATEGYMVVPRSIMDEHSDGSKYLDGPSLLVNACQSFSGWLVKCVQITSSLVICTFLSPPIPIETIRSLCSFIVNTLLASNSSF